MGFGGDTDDLIVGEVLNPPQRNVGLVPTTTSL